MSLDMSQRKVRQLSADAKTFVPGNLRMDETSEYNHTAHRTEVQRLPRYATTCYPFAAPDGGHARQRLSATWQGPGRPEYLYDPNKSAGLKNTFLTDNLFVPSLKMPYGEFSGYNQPQIFAPYQCNLQEVQDSQTFGQSHTILSGDVQYTVHFPHFPLPAAQSNSNIWMVAPDCLSGQNMPSLLGSSATMAQVHGTPVHQGLLKANQGQSKVKKMSLNSNQVSVGIQYELTDQETDLKEKALNRRRTIICKDCETQTDFSSDFASKNLQTLPSPLYNKSSKNWLLGENSTDSEELEFDGSYCDSPWRRQLQMAESTSADDASLFLPSVLSNIYALDPQPWLVNKTPLSSLYVSGVSTMPEALMCQTLEDPGVNMMPYDARFSVGHTNKFSTAFSNGVCWSPVARSVPSQGSLFETKLTQSQRRRWRQTKGIALDASRDASTGACQTLSVGTDAILGGLGDVEEEFPKLLTAAGGLPSPCDNTEMMPAATDEKKLGHPQPENFEHFKWTDSSSCIFTMKKSAVVSVRDGSVKSANKKKQKRQEQLSRAADEELAEISLEQQVLREISSGHRRLAPSFPPADDFLSPASSVTRSPSFVLGSTESLELSELSAHTAQPEMVICKEHEEKLRGNSGTILEASPSLNHFTMSFGDENIPLNHIELSQSTASSKTSSMDAGDRGTPASADLSPISQTSPLSMSSPTSSPFGSGITSPRNGLTDLNKFSIISQIHSPRFREYCSQVLSREIDECCTELLQRLIRVQDRHYQFDRDNRTNSVKRRTVLGLREVTKHLKMSHLCCVIISPNMDITQAKGGLEEALRNIIKLCEERKVLFVFALGRHALGRACAKLVPVSVVGIFSCDGAEEHFHQLQKLTRQARSAYQEMVATLLRSNGTNALQPTLSLNAGHSRTPSGCSVMSVTSSILSEPISENDSERDSTAEGIPVEEVTSTEANKFLLQDYMKNGKDGANSHSDESASTSDESSDQEKVTVCDQLCYKADSAGEHLALQSSDTRENEATCYAFTPNNGRAAFRKLATNCDHYAQVLVMDVLKNSSKDSITQENGHLNEGSDTDTMKTNTLPVENSNECTWSRTKKKYSDVEPWIPATESTKDPICIELLTKRLSVTILTDDREDKSTGCC